LISFPERSNPPALENHEGSGTRNFTSTERPGHPPTERLIRARTWIIYVLFFLGGILASYAALIEAETEIAE